MESQLLTKLARERSISKNVRVGQGFTKYWEYPSSSGSQETLVLVHGYRGNHRGLEAIAGNLSEFRVLIPDLPGFGESDEFEAEHSVENYANWLEGFLGALGIANSAHIIGHSFGTLVVGRFASSRFARSVTLINPVSTPPLAGDKKALTTLATNFYKFSSWLPRKFGESLLRNRLSVLVMSIAMAKTRDRVLRKWIHAQHLENFSDFKSARVALEGYRASIGSALENYAPNISAPVLIIATDLDDITTLSDQRRVSKLYQRSELVEIHGVGHLTHYEAPTRAADEIRKFIGRLS